MEGGAALPGTLRERRNFVFIKGCVNLADGGCVYQEFWEIFEGGLWKQSIYIYGSSVRGTWRGGGPLLGTLKDIQRRALEIGISLLRGHVGERGVGSFTRTFERPMKEGSGDVASLIKLIWAPFLWIQITLGAWVWGQLGTSMKDQGSHDLASEYGA